MKKRLFIIYPNLLLAIITLLGLFFGIFYIRNGIFDFDFFTAVIMVGMAWFAVVSDKLLKLKLSSFIYCCYYIFLLLTLFFGRMLSFYYRFSWYRGFIDFLGGIFTTLIGILIIVRLDNLGFMKFSVVLTYALFFSGFAISLWQLLSGLTSELFGSPQNDIARRIGFGLSGSLLFSVLLILDYLIYHSRYLEKIIRKI